MFIKTVHRRFGESDVMKPSNDTDSFGISCHLFLGFASCSGNKSAEIDDPFPLGPKNPVFQK